MNCAAEPGCVWSAKKQYLDAFKEEPNHVSRSVTERRLLLTSWQWMLKYVVESEAVDIELLAETLKTSRFGKCVYEAANNVVDHQVVNIEYANGATAQMTSMSACE